MPKNIRNPCIIGYDMNLNLAFSAHLVGRLRSIALSTRREPFNSESIFAICLLVVYKINFTRDIVNHCLGKTE